MARALRPARIEVRSERGSLPLAMLALFVIGSLVTVLVATVVTGQRQTRFDQSFEHALQTAEVGLDRLVYQVLHGELEETTPMSGTTAEGAEYEAVAELLTDGTWVITSTGRTVSGVERTVRAEVGPQNFFTKAAFGKFFIDFNGGNAADSYRSGTFTEFGFDQSITGAYICSPTGTRLQATGSANSDIVMCNATGKGVVATNGELNLKGNAFDKADLMEVHYAMDSGKVENPHPDATGFCSMTTARCNDPRVSYHREPLELKPDPVPIPPDLVPGGNFPADHPDGNVLKPGRYLFGDVTLDKDTVFEGTPDAPVVIYMTGRLRIPNHHAVNFETGADGHPQPRPAPSLFIYSNSDGNEALQFGNHASFAGAVYAPNAGFSGGAQGNIYGSMIAGSINNNGGWNFHWDEALGDVVDLAPLAVMNWTEE